MPQVVINNFPHDISDGTFYVDVTIIGAKSGTNYLRIELFKEGTTNYFGETFNTKDWYGGSDSLSYFPIEIKSASTSATIQGRIGKTENYPGPGSYDLKIKRYTQSGNAADDNSQSVSVNINYVLLTPAATETATQIPTATIFNTPVVTPEEILESKKIVNTPEVLALRTEQNTRDTSAPLSMTQSQTQSVKENKDSFPIFAAGIFAIGLFLIGMAAYLIYNKQSLRKSEFRKIHAQFKKQ